MDDRFKELEERLKNYADRVNLMEEDLNYLYKVLVAAHNLGLELGKKQGKELAMLEIQKHITFAKIELGLGC